MQHDPFYVRRLLPGLGILLAGTAVFLSGCVPLPQQPEPEIKQVSQYETAESLSGPEKAWPEDLWWKSYNDPQLDSLIDEALKNSPTMTIAAARLHYASAVSQLMGSTLKPQVYGDASGGVQKLSYNYDLPPDLTPHGTHSTGSMALSVGWELDFWGKNRAALAAATSEEKAAAADMAGARLVLASSIAAEYGELARLFAADDVLTSIVRVQGKSLELFEKRFKHGLENQATVKQARSRLAATEEEKLSIERQIGLQRNLLAALMGAGPDRGLKIERPKLNLNASFALPKEIPMNLLGRRPDIAAARMRAESKLSMIEKQKAEFYPNINLSAFLGYQAGFGMLFKSGSDFYNVGPAISLPIFTGGRLTGQLEMARAEHNEAIGLYNQTITNALQEVSDAAVNQKALIKQLEKIKTAADSAADAHKMISDRYKGGLANYLEVLTAEETLLNTLRTQSNLQSQIFVLDVALVKALGGGYKSPEADAGKPPSPEKN